MKVFIVLLTVTSLAFSYVTRDEYKRRYFPEEERANSKEHIVVLQDDNGNYHFVDLKASYEVGTPPTEADVNMYLYTRVNSEDPIKIPAEGFDGLIDSELFDPSKTIVVSIHGWVGTYLSNTNNVTRRGILANEDANVLVADWSGPAAEFYTIARRAVPVVGKIIAEFLNKMMDKYNISSDKIILVGQSFGGQVIGITGSFMNGQANSAIALDPSKPLFYIDEPEECLDPTDAAYVQVIHTNGGFLGFRSSLGHADYFPNGGGMNQPGCGPDIFGTCAHYRAYWYYGESLLTQGFNAVKCRNYEDFKAGLCDDNEKSFMGQHPMDTNARGDFYLDTAGEEPYALG